MTMRRRRAALLTLLVLAGSVLAGILWLQAQRRQYTLNRQLIAAEAHNDLKRVLALVNQGADPNTHYLPTPVPSLLERVQQFLHRSPPPVNNSPTAFSIACGARHEMQTNQSNNASLTQVNGMNPGSGNAIPIIPLIPITTACAHNPELIRLMLEHGADVNAQDDRGMTPLMEEAEANVSADTLGLLLKHGANVNAKNYYDHTALMFAAESNRSPDTLRLLLKHGASVNAQDAHGTTPLLVAVAFDAAPATMRLLLEYGANVNVPGIDGRTALVEAMVYQAAPATVRLLIEHGANVNAQDDFGRTALYYAVEFDVDNDFIRQLLAYGADPNLADKDGITPISLAHQQDRSDNVVLLRQAGASK